MNTENDRLTHPAAASAPQSAPQEAVPAAKAPRRGSAWPLVALVAIGLAGAQWWDSRQRLQGIDQEVSRRLGELDLADKETRGVQKQLLEQFEAVQAKTALLETRVGESPQVLNQEIARGREEAALLEVEQAVTLASQQLQIAANTPAALAVLQHADTRLARLDRPQYLPLRKALTKDIDRLAGIPPVDVAGISVRLEQAITNVDKLPLAFPRRPQDRVEPAPKPEPTTWWERVGGELWQEVKGLVRIQRFDRMEPALVAPSQEFFLRENLKLRLLNARLAMLSRNPAIYGSELKASQEWLNRHFIADDQSVKAMAVTIDQLQAVNVGAELPTLNDTLAALRAVRITKEKP